MFKIYLSLLFITLSFLGRSNSILIPMDEHQKNHLKAYGIAFDVLKKGGSVDWLLNYRGGGFLITHSSYFESECVIRGVSFELLNVTRTNAILQEISAPEVNMSLVKLETAPKIAVYSPKNALVGDDTDAVIAALDYAEIPYTIIYDEEIISDHLLKYDWLHLHHEDFTGQHGRFMRRESAVLESKLQEATARQLGFEKVSQMKLAVAKRIKAFCAGGGFLFAMCSGAETFDIALAADGVDISESIYDGDDSDADSQSKLDFTKTLAFENFTLEPGLSRRFSDINTGRPDFFEAHNDFFIVFNFSAKWDVVPSMLTQNHENVIKEFMGQTSSFNKYVIKPDVLVLGENRKVNNVRYMYGELGRGHWTFYSGHDPEGVAGGGGGGGRGGRRTPTDLNLHPHSPGYRLILNNVLFPSAKKRKQKT
ncbi:MAG: asparagine synthetase B [Cyclobacteriaceae bacterium]|nr:asparagine synthetase B [Cyclobacteriaceae bacterium]